MSTRYANRKSVRTSVRKARGPLSKAMLLPLQESAACEVSLAQHLTWVACKRKSGSAYPINELVRLVHLTYYVQDGGYGDTDPVVYARAEDALERCLKRAERERIWRLGPDDAPLFEAILCQADSQLERALRYMHVDARERLERFAVSGRQSPLAGAAHLQ
ncbi:Fis family transcriptional regulator [Caballeronia catudaia]|uniref:Fis family transcriptional regulator n=1 Tax=Caballeronia catudaia TaxID=1777136 RepID=A0A158D486_9BURK|nr:hypothetical protein [Caballeronia catudaia]SAK89455.1 Fis family transcriptional regulator [Caballeronia catudaia]